MQKLCKGSRHVRISEIVMHAPRSGRVGQAGQLRFWVLQQVLAETIFLLRTALLQCDQK